MLTRRSFLSRASLGTALGATGALFGTEYATAVEPHRVRLTHYTFTPSRWPAGLKLRIAVLADFHAHPRTRAI